MLESNHYSINQTMDYSYASEHDETERIAAISRGVLSDQYFINDPAKKPSEPRAIARKKYFVLREDPNTRLLLDGSLCVDRACVPSFERCSKCEHFHVDSLYINPLQEYIQILTERVQKLETLHGNPETIRFLRRQISTYKCMLEKTVEDNEIKQEVS